MTGEEAVLLVVGALERANAPYMLAGSFSSNLYGVPRSTRDADFVVQVDAGVIFGLVRGLGPDFRVDSQVAFETVTGTTKLVAWIDSVPFKFEFFLLSDDPHDRERFARRIRVPFFGGQAVVPMPEDVVITKLRWSRQGNRAKDREDVANVVAVQGDKLDWAYLRAWCDQHGTRTLLDELCQESLGRKLSKDG